MVHYSGKRISIFTGHYGSGKTEISIDYALKSKGTYDKMALVDLDFVNPYFRSREVREYLGREGIQVIASAQDYINTDLPAFSPQITGVLGNKDVRVIVDLGGDEIGARAAGRFRNHIGDDQYELLFVLNPFRPFTAAPDDVCSLIKEIEASSRLEVTALVSNPNLAGETTLLDVMAGHDKVLEAGRLLSLPVKMLTVEESLSGLPEIENLDIPVLKLKRVMLTPWEQ